MQHFFILTNLGVDFKKWNQVLLTNPFLISHFNEENPRYYLNRHIEFEPCEYEKYYTRHFDILVFNWQTGFKDSLDLSQLIHINAPHEICVKRLELTGVINKKCIESYLELRNAKIQQTLKRNKNHLILDASRDMEYNLHGIVDFLRIPFYFTQGINQ